MYENINGLNRCHIITIFIVVSIKMTTFWFKVSLDDLAVHLWSANYYFCSKYMYLPCAFGYLTVLY